MQQPLTIINTENTRPNPADAQKHPWPYAILYAHKQVYPYGSGLVAEQYYDAKLLFLHQVEMVGAAGLHVTGVAGQTDLYWFYMMEGELIISQEDQEGVPLVLRQKRAYLLQLPAGNYQLQAPQGHCVWFYFCYRKSWLLRYRESTLRSFSGLFEKLAIPEPLLLLDLHIDPSSRLVLSRLFRLREQNPIYLEQQVTRCCLNLLFTFRQALIDLQYQLPGANSLLATIRQFCEDQIRLGYLPKVSEIKEAYQRSQPSIVNAFKRAYGINLQQYITHLRMEEAKRLMIEEGLNPTEAAYQMGYYDPTAFGKAFRKHFGFNPGELLR